MGLEDNLPPRLRSAGATITRIAAGMSGAGVYRVEAAGEVFVLKIAGERENEADWRRAIEIQRVAADAGLAPAVVHVDEARRAVTTAFVADRSFIALYRTPQTHDDALALLARTIRRVHALPIPANAPARDPRAFLAQLWAGLRDYAALPDFARDAIERALADVAPPSDRGVVLGHNDLNPTNLVYDGERIVLLDWATAGPMEPLYDLAVLALFLRMDGPTCAKLLAAYDERDGAVVPARLVHLRRLAAAMVGTMQLHLARQLGPEAVVGGETLDATPSLGTFYARLRAGAVAMGTAAGQRAFGLTMLKQSLMTE